MVETFSNTNLCESIERVFAWENRESSREKLQRKLRQSGRKRVDISSRTARPISHVLLTETKPKGGGDGDRHREREEEECRNRDKIATRLKIGRDFARLRAGRRGRKRGRKIKTYKGGREGDGVEGTGREKSRRMGAGVKDKGRRREDTGELPSGSYPGRAAECLSLSLSLRISRSDTTRHNVS